VLLALAILPALAVCVTAQEPSETPRDPDVSAGMAQIGASTTDTTQSSGDPDALEARRLRSLLIRYRSDAVSEVHEEDTTLLDTAVAPPSAGDTVLAEQLNQPFGPQKVLLRAADMQIAVDEIERRLNDARIDERRSDAPLICALQTRLGGSLVASTPYSMTHIGKHHFLTRIALAAGVSTLSAADQRWRIELPTDSGGSSFLLTLYAPPVGVWELHALPLAALEAERDSYPAWLTARLADSTPAP
jgi:hypothetical protein